MRLAQNALRVFMALLLAVPLGAGGLCCCLTDGMGQEVMAEMMRTPPPSSCCTQDEPAPSSREGLPDEHECDCPAVSDATLASPPAEVIVAASPVAAPAPAAPRVAVATTSPVSAVAPLAHSPPGPPLYLANSVFRS